MTVVPIFTKKSMNSVSESDDIFDLEYKTRVKNIKTKDQLNQLLEDYEEFLPEGLQVFRNCDDDAFKELISQVQRAFAYAKKGQLLADPTEAMALVAPPMITMPRMMAFEMNMLGKKQGKDMTGSNKVTWGIAFKKLAMEGMITKLAESQDRMYRRVIEIKEIVKEVVDTSSDPD